jgi:hypothetical protein
MLIPKEGEASPLTKHRRGYISPKALDLEVVVIDVLHKNKNMISKAPPTGESIFDYLQPHKRRNAHS